ncbi:DMT family transporter [Martelella mediterranea]|uniref:S-adenosylmethionine uptake transporter n=1 Tax=Martelella mediterranea TaxID=293089 RepID=A0A4R3NI19_9HYPH|nr:DMT family transporter [Martelella mediterranea]TCT31091.1 S-adenosylmethionine uptake transporter [Martelella mediterranea]
MSSYATPGSGTLARDARKGIFWLLTNLVLTACMTSLVKLNSESFPAIQIVFVRAVTGLILTLPLIWRARHQVIHVRHPKLNLARVLTGGCGLSLNFVALSMLPLVTVQAINFTSPLLVMALAMLFLNEKVSGIRWTGALIAFGGIMVLVGPEALTANPGVLAGFAAVLFASSSTIQTRMLQDENTLTMLTFYTVGLVVFTGIPAFFVWQPVALNQWPLLLAVGLFAQCGQFTWLRAYQSTDASILAPFSYLSVLLAAVAGFIFFQEVPGLRVYISITIILTALQGTAWLEARRRARLRGRN